MWLPLKPFLVNTTVLVLVIFINTQTTRSSRIRREAITTEEECKKTSGTWLPKDWNKPDGLKECSYTKDKDLPCPSKLDKKGLRVVCLAQDALAEDKLVESHITCQDEDKVRPKCSCGDISSPFVRNPGGKCQLKSTFDTFSKCPKNITKPKCDWTWQPGKKAHCICEDVKECDQPGRGGCGEKRCKELDGMKNQVVGYKCISCGPHHKLNKDTNTCEKIDYCATTPCAEQANSNCAGKTTGYSCKCMDGYFKTTTSAHEPNCIKEAICEPTTCPQERQKCVEVKHETVKNKSLSTRCECKKGFTKNKLGECKTPCESKKCDDESTTCDKKTAECACKNDYKSVANVNLADQKSCIKKTNCELKSVQCDFKNTVCDGTAEKPTCSCKEGFLHENGTSGDCRKIKTCETVGKCKNGDERCREGKVNEDAACVDLCKDFKTENITCTVPALASSATFTCNAANGYVQASNTGDTLACTERIDRGATTMVYIILALIALVIIIAIVVILRKKSASKEGHTAGTAH